MAGRYSPLLFKKTSHFKDNSSITLAALLLKTLFLIGLASGARIVEIAALRRYKDHCKFRSGDSGISLCVHKGFLHKSERRLKRSPIIRIPCLTKEGNNYLCPVKALKAWLERTRLWINPNNYLWLNAANRKPAILKLLSLRFKALIRLAHNADLASNFHQLRKVAASLAFDKGLPIADLFSRANWNSKSVFFKHYYAKANISQNCFALRNKC